MKIDENRCTIVQNRASSENRRKSLYSRSKSFNIDEHRCTVVQNRSKSMKIVVLSSALPSARPSALRRSAPAVHLSAARPPSVSPTALRPVRPPSATVRPSARSGAGRTFRPPSARPLTASSIRFTKFSEPSKNTDCQTMYQNSRSTAIGRLLLVLKQTASSDAESKDADHHCFCMGWMLRFSRNGPPKWTPRAVYPPLVGLLVRNI